ncbi:MAG: LysR family transcriptional regulator [Clostridiales bacterium]|nr:LysR family transcriptional regulator [Clostridiales bacterium]
MDTQKLETFIAIAETLNFTEAGSRLGLSQSAISQQIAELEKQFDAKLLNRKTRPVQLTPTGQILLKEAYGLVAKANETFNKTQLANKGVIGFLKVGYLGGIERGFLPKAISEFREIYPNIDLSLHQYHWGEINKALENDEIDVGFTMKYGLELFPDLVTKELFTNVIPIALPRKHRLVGESAIDLAWLKNESFISLNSNSDFLLYDLTMHLCKVSGFTPHMKALCKDIDSILFNVEAGLGISILPYDVKVENGHDIKFVGIDHPEKNFTVLAAWNKHSLNKAVNTFVNLLEASYMVK